MVEELSPPFPKRRAYDFFLTERIMAMETMPDASFDFRGFRKESERLWRKLDGLRKISFIEQAAQDVIRFATEKAAYRTRTRPDKRKRVKDLTAPKRPLSAFVMFCAANRGDIIAENPQIQVGDLAMELGRRWADLIDTSLYDRLYEENMIRYTQEMTNYLATAPLEESGSETGQPLKKLKLDSPGISDRGVDPRVMEDDNLD